MSRARLGHEAGFTILELSITAVLSVILLGAGVMTLISGNQASTSTISYINADTKLRDVLQTMSDELRFSSRDAEDTNNNATLDAGEDTNGNTRFEHDWSLSSSSVTFNVRRASGGYSLPITYSLVGDELHKRVMTHANGREALTVLARDVSSFTITDANPGIIVNLALNVRTPGGDVQTRSQSITVLPRN